MEHSLAASPLFAVEYEEEWSLGDFITHITGLSGFFDNAKQINSIAGKMRGLQVQGKNLKKQYLNNIPDTTNGPITFSGNPLDYTEAFYYGIDALEKKIVDQFNKDIKNRLGLESKIKLSFKGFYDVHIKLKTVISNQSFVYTDYKENIKNYKVDNEVVMGKNKGIDALITMEASFVKEVKWGKLNRYIPTFLQKMTNKQFTNTQTEVFVKGELKGTLYFERIYNYSPVAAIAEYAERKLIGTTSIAQNMAQKGITEMPVYQDNIIFTGIIGEILIKIKHQENDDGGWEYEVGQKNKETGETEAMLVELVPPFVVNGEKKPLYPDINTQ